MDEGKKKIMAVKKSISNYPKPKSVHTKEKEKTPNPNNPDGKEHHFRVSLDNAVSFNLTEI